MIAFLTNYGIIDSERFKAMKSLFLEKGYSRYNEGKTLKVYDGGFNADDCYQNNVLCIGTYQYHNGTESYSFMTIIVVPNTGSGGNRSTIAVHMDQSEYAAPNGEWVTQPFVDASGNTYVNLFYGDWEWTKVRGEWRTWRTLMQ